MDRPECLCGPDPNPEPGGFPRVVVFGYHDMGVACLQELLHQGANVVAVVTHADDPTEASWFGSVADLARQRAIPVLTPGDPNAPAIVERLRALGPDLIFSFYYRRLLSPALLALPTLAAINLHGSLLPKYRGRAPLNWVLLRGEERTGVTLHHMDEWADHGDIVGQREVAIAIEDTALTLWRKLLAAGRQLLAEMYPLIAAGRAPRVPQDHAAATSFGRRRPADGLIDWTRSAREIYNLIRAVTHPFPGAFTFRGDRRIFLWSARAPGDEASPGLPGTLLGTGAGGSLRVATGQGILEVLRLQPEGGAEQDGADFSATVQDMPGARFSFAPRGARGGSGGCE
ncbi:MAG TPA: formyltransferase [Candidatus Methylomirabilis sp.]|nr:formyltransferase [Candidatus Methylomirabilis sp.]